MNNKVLTTILMASSCLSMSAEDKVNPKKQNKRPNILFAISDDQSFPHASAYGTTWVKTPGFDRVASEGLLFMNCYTPNAKSSPSRTCIITGRNSWQLDEVGNHNSYVPDYVVSCFEVIRDHTNYFMGYTGKEIEPIELRSPERVLVGKAWNRIRSKKGIPGVANTDYAANFEEFLAEKPEDSPFCFWYGAREPHRNFKYRIGIDQGGKSIEDIDRVPGFWPDCEDVRIDMLDYAFEVEHFDHHLERMITMLEEAGELDNTIIIVTSDNGMCFPRVKSTGYDISHHLPLAIMWSEGINSPGRTITDYVSFIDLAPTFFDLTGVKKPEKLGMLPIEGESLMPIFKSRKNGRVVKSRNYVLLGKDRHDAGRPDDAGYPIRSIIQEGFMYIHNFEPDRWPHCNPEVGYPGASTSPTKTEILNYRRSKENYDYWKLCFGKRVQEEFYDLTKDSDCIHNLIDREEYKGLITSMKEKMFKKLKEQGDPRMFGKGYFFDAFQFRRAYLRDYYLKAMFDPNFKIYSSESDIDIITEEDLKEIYSK